MGTPPPPPPFCPPPGSAPPSCRRSGAGGAGPAPKSERCRRALQLGTRFFPPFPKPSPSRPPLLHPPPPSCSEAVGSAEAPAAAALPARGAEERMALTPNFRKVESLLEVCGEQILLEPVEEEEEEEELVSSGVPESVLAAEVGGDMLGGGAVLGR